MSRGHYRQARVRCPICDLEVTGAKPRGGDGSGLRVRPHDWPSRRGSRCPGSYAIVTVEHVVSEAKGIRT